MNTSTYVFWLFELSTIELYSSYRWYPQYICMRVSKSQLILETAPQPIIIPFNLLDTAEKHVHFQNMYAGRAYGVKLKLHQPISVPPKGTSSAELYLAPVDPLGWRPCLDEINTLLEVIDTFKKGQNTTIPENPYQRALHRKGRSGEFSEAKWNRNTPPNIYTPPPQMLRTAVTTFLGLIPIVLTIMAVVGLLAWLGWI